MAKTKSEYQAKYHRSRIDPTVHTAEEIEEYLAKRREQDRLQKQIKKREKKDKIGLSGLPAEKNAKSASGVAGENITIAEWSPTHTGMFGDLPECNKGSVIACPESLEGDNAMAAMVLEGVSHYLQDHWISDEIDDLRFLATVSLPKITGIRSITGNRYELYVRVKDSTPAAFYTILRLSERLRRANPHLVLTDDELCKLVTMIVGLATDRAGNAVPTTHALQNFAYIILYGSVDSQDVHIDLCEPKQFQLGMMCSHKGELTYEYECKNAELPLQKGDKLTKLWKDLPPGLQNTLDKIKEVQELIDDFGPLLSPAVQKVGKKLEMVPFGTIVCLPGRIMHCGPKVTTKNQLRAVMFFTATPNTDIALAYNSETQYCRSTIFHDILLHSWLKLNSTMKAYMLSKWTEVGLRHDSQDAIELNMNHKQLIVIARALKQKMKTKKLLAKLIGIIAHNDDTWNKKGCAKWWNDKNGEIYEIPTQ